MINHKWIINGSGRQLKGYKKTQSLQTQSDLEQKDHLCVIAALHLSSWKIYSVTGIDFFFISLLQMAP